MKHLSKALVLAAMILTSKASANVAVQRQGSSLRLQWTAAQAGEWRLQDEDGYICARGATSPGANTIDLRKIAAPNPLRLQVTAGDESFDLAIPGDKRLSPLRKPQRAVTIYQLPVRTYLAHGMGQAAAGQFRDLSVARLTEIKQLGVDYLWLTGVLEQASREQTDPDIVKGEAGSYYAIYDKWDVSSQLGTLADFEALIERAHAAGLRVMIDFVANHTARVHRTDILCKQHLNFGSQDDVSRGFASNNNYFYLPGGRFVPPSQAGVAGADGEFDTDVFTPGLQVEQPARVTGNDVLSATPNASDWFETVKLNYGFNVFNRTTHYTPRPHTWMQMMDVARYWIEKGVDGFRADFAHAVPIEFWREFVREAHRANPEVFLLAEAYESDRQMAAPGFSYYALMDAGFDSVYSSEMYWSMRDQAIHPGHVRDANPWRTPVMSSPILSRGFPFTFYMENHDELRVASPRFAPAINDRGARARLGLAYTAYVGLLPGNLMIQGGQELQEDAGVYGSYAKNDGRTSIFDFVYQAYTRAWNEFQRPQWMQDFRQQYQRLLELKRRPAFSALHGDGAPSYIDLDGINWYKDTSRWIASYVRFVANEAYLVVSNTDPHAVHTATVHFTADKDRDSLGALRALGVENNDTRYRFVEIFSRPGLQPTDPAVSGPGLPGWALYRPADVPSGLFLADIPAATTYVFKVENVEDLR